MGWIEGLNDAMDYIERNLEGDLDLARAARLAACTEGQFRRMFSYVAGIGLTEYVRRRRISRAALDLSRGERVVDVAVRYGYGSPTAFTALRWVESAWNSAVRRAACVVEVSWYSSSSTCV